MLVVYALMNHFMHISFHMVVVNKVELEKIALELA